MKTWNFTETMKWISTAVMLLAALAIVEGVYPTSIYLLNLGSLAWLITAIMWREWSLIVDNASLLLVYVYGLTKLL
jgi:F0F1-type ATP synthase assembly protein I